MMTYDFFERWKPMNVLNVDVGDVVLPKNSPANTAVGWGVCGLIGERVVVEQLVRGRNGQWEEEAGEGQYAITRILTSEIQNSYMKV